MDILFTKIILTVSFITSFQIYSKEPPTQVKQFENKHKSRILEYLQK